MHSRPPVRETGAKQRPFTQVWLADPGHRWFLLVWLTGAGHLAVGRERGIHTKSSFDGSGGELGNYMHFIAFNTEISVFCIEGAIVCPYKCIYSHLLVIVGMQYSMLSSQGSAPYVLMEHTFSRLSRYRFSCILLLQLVHQPGICKVPLSIEHVPQEHRNIGLPRLEVLPVALAMPSTVRPAD